MRNVIITLVCVVCLSRNETLNARDPLATINPEERRDQFGGSFSGPVVEGTYAAMTTDMLSAGEANNLFPKA